MSDGYDHRHELRQALQELIPAPDENLGVLKGYVIISEWDKGGGAGCLTRTSGDINDEAPAPWTLEGWLWHGLHFNPDDPDDGGDE